MAILKKRRILQYGIEGTSGTIAGTLAPIFCFDPAIQADIPMTKRAATGVLGELTSVPGAQAASLEFSFELAGSGNSSSPTPAWATALLPTCGWYSSTTGVFKPTSNVANYQTASFALYEQGPSNAVKKVMIGSMGSFSLDGESGKPVMIKFSYKGIWVAVTDVAFPTLPTFPTVPARFVSSTFTVGSFTPKISKLSLDNKGTIKLVESIATSSGYAYAVVTDRSPGGSIDPMAENVATWDPYGEWIAPTPQAMSFTLGATAGNTITIAAPAMQFEDVKEADRDELVTADISFECKQVTGDDEASITFA